MTAPRFVAALDALALALAPALGCAVARAATFAQEGAAVGDAMIFASLPNGASREIARRLGAGARPYDVIHDARLLIGVQGGPPEARDALLADRLGAAASAIEADPTIGGLVADVSVAVGWEEVPEQAGPALVGAVLELGLLIEAETPAG